MTPRWAYPIYDGQYGSELQALFFSGGVSAEFIEAKALPLIKDALLADERIIGVSGFACSADGDRVQLSFDVQTVYGDSEIEAVIIDV